MIPGIDGVEGIVFIYLQLSFKIIWSENIFLSCGKTLEPRESEVVNFSSHGEPRIILKDNRKQFPPNMQRVLHHKR